MKLTLFAICLGSVLGAGWVALDRGVDSLPWESCEASTAVTDAIPSFRLTPAAEMQGVDSGAAAVVALSGVALSGVAPSGVYVEARDATVWGGACHISSEAVSAGRRAALGWAFTGGSHEGVDLAGTQVVAVLEGTCNLQGAEVFGTDEEPSVSSHIWVDAPSALVREAALGFIGEVADLGAVIQISLAKVTVDFEDDLFVMDVEDSLAVRGEAMPDRSCCTMPESRWYTPLAEVEDSVVGNPTECRFEGVHGSLGRWAFEGSNSVFVASIETE